MKLGSIVLCAHFILPQTVFSQNKSELSDAVRAFEKNEYLAHLQFLSDDALEGRGTGTRGYDIAAKYIAAHLKAYGLKPYSENDTFYIANEMKLIRPNEQSSLYK